MIDLVNRRRMYFIISLAVIFTGVIGQVISPDLRWGIEFSSGMTATAALAEQVPEDQLLDTLVGLGYEDATVQRFADGSFFIRMRAADDLETQRAQVLTRLEEAHGEVTSFEFTAVSPVIASETVRNAIVAVIAAVIGILLYVTWAFRAVPRAFRYSISAVIALAHDLLVVFAVTALIAKFMPLEISSMYLVGMLTVLGYSVNDTIVVFDRLRENVLRGTTRDFSSTVNFSILETLSRSLNTSLTTALVLFALLILGPETIRPFIIVLTIGVISGTYSSIFIASQILVAWEARSTSKQMGPAPAARRAARDSA